MPEARGKRSRGLCHCSKAAASSLSDCGSRARAPGTRGLTLPAWNGVDQGSSRDDCTCWPEDPWIRHAALQPGRPRAMTSPTQAHALHQRVMQPREKRCLKFSHNRRVALGIAQPRHNCCWALESCSTLPPNQHWMIATATEISSTARVRDPPGPPCSGRRAPLHAVPEGSPRRALGNPQQRHPFERDHGSACELLHTPERMPTSVATYRLS